LGDGLAGMGPPGAGVEEGRVGPPAVGAGGTGLEGLVGSAGVGAEGVAGVVGVGPAMGDVGSDGLGGCAGDGNGSVTERSLFNGLNAAMFELTAFRAPLCIAT
jgi:hypothetical protein